jgi:hypothetical protein
MGNSLKVIKKTVFLFEDMKDDVGVTIFKAETPYVVENNMISNESNMKVAVDDIWMDFRVEVEKGEAL